MQRTQIHLTEAARDFAATAPGHDLPLATLNGKHDLMLSAERLLQPDLGG